MKVDDIYADITIEELVNEFPSSVRFLMEKGIRCLRCGEPIWGTLKEAALEKDYSEDDIPSLVEELKDYLNDENK